MNQLDKAEYMFDRVMNNLHELPQSKIKQISLNLLENSRAMKKRNVEFKDVHKWAEQQSQLEAAHGLFVKDYELQNLLDDSERKIK